MPESKPPGQVRLGVSPSEREIKLLLVGVKVLRCAEKTAAGNRNSDWLRGLLASLKAKAVKIRFALRRNIKPSHGLGGRLSLFTLKQPFSRATRATSPMDINFSFRPDVLVLQTTHDAASYSLIDKLLAPLKRLTLCYADAG